MDKWPEPSYRLGPREHIHALGAIAANFNRLEETMRDFFCLYCDLKEVIAVTLFAKLNNQLRVDTLRHCVSLSDHPEVIKDRLEHFVKGYDICFQNRNVPMHSITMPVTSLRPEDKSERHYVVFSKSSRDDPMKANAYLPKLPTLRSIADSTRQFDDFGVNLFWHILKEVDPAQAPRGVHWVRDYALPDKPPLPPLLSALGPSTPSKRQRPP